ncbi:hypothetical protein O6H91_05G132000 [Diphasiastrum complanatum]|uniref:Uncharacterized protein n=1 Tax=Diphasiastrum complanatum TaxID=34168 RepID=A0ACC2DU66_DIPCM|nr:hypothetical protein O6H91_05G132000 [Diphasiastrum complanatum]
MRVAICALLLAMVIANAVAQNVPCSSIPNPVDVTALSPCLKWLPANFNSTSPLPPPSDSCCSIIRTYVSQGKSDNVCCVLIYVSGKVHFSFQPALAIPKHCGAAVPSNYKCNNFPVPAI